MFPVEKGKSLIKAEEPVGSEVLNKPLETKFAEIKKSISEMKKGIEQFKNHQLPLARIKKIMKSDEDVRMISSETPVLFATACEIFIVELTHRAWESTLESKRRTLQRADVYSCIYRSEIFDFLIDIIPVEELDKLRKVPSEAMLQVSPKNR